MSKNIVIIVLLLILAIGGTYIYTTRSKTVPPLPIGELEEINDEETIPPTEVSKEEVEEQQESDLDLIKKSLVDKHDWDADNILVTVGKNDGVFASGGVREKTSEVGGGMWFAAKVDSNWKIVYDGNGTILCENLEDYPDYPVALIPECFNEATGKIIKR